MDTFEAFARYQDFVDASQAAVDEARARAHSFKRAFENLEDVEEVFTSGSLRRKTHKDPIHDVDVVIVYKQDSHPDWAVAGESAEQALDYTRDKINSLLGATNGTHEHLVRLARWRNHAVKCYIDDPNDPDAFTVDAMPALRTTTGLLVPEALSDDWISCNPEHLIAEVAKRQTMWQPFTGSVRMLKGWAAAQTDIKIKSLVMEVLALDYLPLGKTKPIAVKEYFVRAAFHVEGGGTVEDPANICGPIQIDLDYRDFAVRLRLAADTAGQAISRAAAGDEAAAIRLWGEVFGDGFPKPPSTTGTPVVVPPVAPRPVKDTPQG